MRRDYFRRQMNEAVHEQLHFQSASIKPTSFTLRQFAVSFAP
jgi:hypothetical protein